MPSFREVQWRGGGVPKLEEKKRRAGSQLATEPGGRGETCMRRRGVVGGEIREKREGINPPPSLLLSFRNRCIQIWECGAPNLTKNSVRNIRRRRRDGSAHAPRPAAERWSHGRSPTRGPGSPPGKVRITGGNVCMTQIQWDLFRGSGNHLKKT